MSTPLYVIEEADERVEATLEELLEANEDLDDETVERIIALAVGDAVTLDEGAGGEWTVRRIS